MAIFSDAMLHLLGDAGIGKSDTVRHPTTIACGNREEDKTIPSLPKVLKTRFHAESFNLDDAVNALLVAIEGKVDAYWTKQEYTHDRPTYSLMPGRRYIRIVSSGHGQRSVWGFVDKTNGDILKAEGWKKPAKHARGNVFNLANALLDWTGPAYLRG